MTLEHKLEIYKTFIHYGKIVTVKELDLTLYGGNYVTVKVIEYEGIKLEFIMINGEIIDIKQMRE